VSKVVETFDITVANPCSSATLTGTTGLRNSGGSSTTTMEYTIGATEVLYDFDEFTISDASCNPVSYWADMTVVSGDLTGLTWN